MFGKMKCQQCGTVLEGQEALKNSGSTFCSENCADGYKKSTDDKNQCCC